MKIAVEACQKELNKRLDRYKEVIGKIEAMSEEKRKEEIDKVGEVWFYGEKMDLESKIKELTRAIMYLKAIE